jgi:hypothetical protein
MPFVTTPYQISGIAGLLFWSWAAPHLAVQPPKAARLGQENTTTPMMRPTSMVAGLLAALGCTDDFRPSEQSIDATR